MKMIAATRLALSPRSLLFGLCMLPAAGFAGEEPSAPAELRRPIERVYPALVRIHVVSLDYGGGREQKFEAAGSGVIISPEGHVVTNHHVAGKAKRIRCTLSSREEVAATRVGTDALADIAVLKLHLSERRDPSQPIPFAPWGESAALRVGERVLAMGSPLALSQSVTAGVVSNLNLILPQKFMGEFVLDGEDVGLLVKWIGHDAQIFPGNSGGPLVNLRGEIVGINDIGVGLGGAIPGDLARLIAETLVGQGEVPRSWTGLELQPLLKDSADEAGILVGGAIAGSPAARAGIVPGDVILSFGGTPLHARFQEEVPPANRILLETPIGKTVPVELKRAGGKEDRVELTTERRPAAQGREAELRSWGITVSELTLLVAQELLREPASGVLVTSLRTGGPAADAKPPLRDRDVITAVAGRAVKSVEDLQAVTGELVVGKESPVPALVAFDRRSERLLTLVKLGPEPRERSIEARKAWFPAATQVLTGPLAEALGLAGQTGVRVTQVYPVPAAQASGLRVGDVIVTIDGDRIPAHQNEDLQVFPTLIRQRKIGARIELGAMRDGKPIQIQIELPGRPEEDRELDFVRNEPFEFTAREISFRDRVDNRWPEDTAGAVLGSVEPGGWAAFAGLKVGDLVTAVEGRTIRKVEDLKTALEEVSRRRPQRVLFHIRRGIHARFVQLETSWPAER